MAKITVKIPGRPVTEIPISKDRAVTIGRDPSNDLQLDNPAVSRYHAKVYKQDWPFYIEDLDSTNGTNVNDERITWKRVLNTNDRITIGKCVMIFSDSPADYEEGMSPSADPSSTIIVSRPRKP